MSEAQTRLQKYSAPALEKGLDIIEFLSLTDTRPSLSQLAAGIGRSKSEIFRMMIVLEERGYIRRFDGDTFGLTDRMALLGGTQSDNGKLAELATPYLDRLSDQINLSSHLSVGSEEGLGVIASTSAVQNYGLSVLVGYKTKLFGTSAGACILSKIDDSDRRDDLLKRSGTVIDPRTKVAFDESIESCRLSGFAALPSPESHSILEMSAPVQHLPSKSTIGAMTVPIFGSDTVDNRKDHIAQSLLEAVRQLQDKIAITMPKPRQSDVFT
jgi:DNA-binding IclR family transcriptional regulator